METKESDNLNRDQLLEELKAKCKSIVKRDLLLGIIVWIIVILLLIFTWQRLDNPKNIFYIIFWIIIVCFGGWLLLFDFRFLKKVDNLDTPNRLLYWFEKKHRYNFIGWLVSMVFILGGYILEAGFDFGAIVGVVLAIGIIASLFYYGDGPWWYRKDNDIIEQLRELGEKK